VTRTGSCTTGAQDSQRRADRRVTTSQILTVGLFYAHYGIG